jgi:hypothetical protein
VDEVVVEEGFDSRSTGCPSQSGETVGAINDVVTMAWTRYPHRLLTTSAQLRHENPLVTIALVPWYTRLSAACRACRARRRPIVRLRCLVAEALFRSEAYRTYAKSLSWLVARAVLERALSLVSIVCLVFIS